MTKLTLSDVNNILGNPTSAQTTINNNNTLIEQAIENTLSRDGSTPNTMSADIDMDGNDLLNVGVISAESLAIAGSEDFLGLIQGAQDAADEAQGYAADAAASAAEAALWDPSSYSTTTQMNTALANKADKATSVTAGTGLSGGGTLAADRTLSVNFATSGESLAGTSTTKVSNPAGVKAYADAAIATAVAAIDSGSFPVPANVVTFTTTGSYTPSSGTKLILVSMVGGGGQGGSGIGSSIYGGGGGAGGQTIFLAAVSDATTYTATVGTGGSTGSANQNGADGGDTTMTISGTTYTAAGGKGGLKTSGSYGVGGAGGVGSGGLFNFSGNSGASYTSGSPAGGEISFKTTDNSTYGRGGAGNNGSFGFYGTSGFIRITEFI